MQYQDKYDALNTYSLCLKKQFTKLYSFRVNIKIILLFNKVLNSITIINV